MRRVLGIGVEEGRVRAVALAKGRVVWAAEAEYAGPAELADVLARLAAERPARVRTARVALGADVAHCKVVRTMPKLPARDLAAHVALQPRRYFLQNGASLVTDAVLLRGASGNGQRAALLAAAPLPLVEAIADGLSAAGLRLDAIAPAAECLARAPRDPSGLQALGDASDRYAAAYAAATGAPRVALLPAALRHQNRRERMVRARRWALAGAVSLLLAIASYVTGLVRQRRAAEAERERLRPSVSRALAARGDLEAASGALAFLARAERERTRRTLLLARVTQALPDSAFLAAFRLDADGQGALVGYAPRATDVVAALERLEDIRAPTLDGPVTREVQGSTEWDRFTVRFRINASGGTP